MTHHPSMLDLALDYAARGWAVFPIRPGTKAPATTHGCLDATTDVDQITQWWTRWPDHPVAIATGEASGFWVLDIDAGGGKVGEDSWLDLVAEHATDADNVICTLEVMTPSGGRHFYFALPTFTDERGPYPEAPQPIEIRNDQAGRLGRDLDVRGTGGYVLAPGSLHPNGGRYEWEASSHPDDLEMAPAPDWLIELLTSAPAPSTLSRERRLAIDVDRSEGPGDRFEARVTWAELLEGDGATFLGQRTERSSGEPYELWSRAAYPGEEGFTTRTSASLNYMGGDVLKVFSPNWHYIDKATGEVCFLEQDATYSRFGYWVATKWGGDFSAAARHLRLLEDQASQAGIDELLPAPDLLQLQPTAEATPRQHGWEPVDLTDFLDDDYDPPRPDTLTRTDGAHLFYSQRVNTLIGESGEGKSWTADYAIAQVLLDRADVGCLYLDFEDHASSVLSRMRQLGVPAEVLRERFIYINPSLAWNPPAAASLEALVRDFEVVVAVIDSTGEALALDGVKPNEDDEVARWFQRVPRFLAALGPAVILIDHVPKSNDASRLKAIGSQRKQAGLDGAGYRVDAVVAPARGVQGHITLTCTKDRSGCWQKGKIVANATIEDRADGTTSFVLSAPAPSNRPTVLMERVSRFVEDEGTCTKHSIEEAVEGKAKSVRDAIAILVQEDYLEMKPKPGRGGGFQITSLKPYRDEEQTSYLSVDDLLDGSSSKFVPSSSPRLGRGSVSSEVKFVPLVPPHKGDEGRASRDPPAQANLSCWRKKIREARPLRSQSLPTHLSFWGILACSKFVPLDGTNFRALAKSRPQRIHAASRRDRTPTLEGQPELGRGGHHGHLISDRPGGSGVGVLRE